MICLFYFLLVYSWGDGDFGKLGRGGSEGCSIPYNIEKLNGVGICQIECGAQVHLSLIPLFNEQTLHCQRFFSIGGSEGCSSAQS
jgi:Regulator of chromosome condensation (RCC1) repeat